jgi:O-antigen/teichoic acid export membrane protein
VKGLKGGALLTGGQAIAFGSSFVRNIILARTLSKADFGLSAAFAMTITLLELTSRMSFTQQLVQSPAGERDDFLTTTHLCQAVFGVLSAVMIAVLSFPLAQAFDAPHAAWAFTSLAMIPFLRAFDHLQVFLWRRHLNFTPSVLCDVVPNIVVTLTAWPLATLVPDFRAVVILLVAKAALTTLMTHLLAERRYRVRLNRDYLPGIWAFSWPLLLNGFVMFFAQQGDQLLVGTFLSLEQLAVYAVAFSLVSIPWFMGANVFTSLLLPILSRVQDDPVAFRRQYSRCLAYVSLACSLMLSPLILLGGFLIQFFYGDKYSGATMLTAVLGLTCGVRFLRLAPAIAAIATADAKNQLYSNIWRGISFPLALVAVWLNAGVVAFALCALAAEIAAAVFSFFRFSVRSGLHLAEQRDSLLLMLVCFGVSFLIGALQIHWTMMTAVAAGVTSVLFCLGLARVFLPDTFQHLWRASSVAFLSVRANVKAA